MYDKMTRSPPVGSVREAMLLTVWLRRQELEVKKMQVLVNAIGDLILKEGTKNTVKSYDAFLQCAFPFIEKARGDTDQKLIEAMKKEAERGPIVFTPTDTMGPFRKVAARMREPDEFLKKFGPTRARRIA